MDVSMAPAAVDGDSSLHGGREQPLIGVENVALPTWAAVDTRVASAGVWQAVRALPKAVGAVVRLSWRTSPRLTLLAGVVHVVSGCVTAFGLVATSNVFTALLQAGPTPNRVIDSLPALAVVVGSYTLRGALDAAVAATEASLRPRVTTVADEEVTAAVVRVQLLAFEDADFRELARQGGRDGVRAIESSLRYTADLVSSGIAMVAAVVTAGLLNVWLVPVLLLAAAPSGWSAGQVAKLRYRHFLDTVTMNMRKSVIEEAATHRSLAQERHALTLQDRLFAEYRRVGGDLMREDIRLAHRANRIQLVGRGWSGVGTAGAYVVLGVLLYTGAMELALAGTAALAMRTASAALSNTMRSVNFLYEDGFYIDFYNQLLTESAARQPAPSRESAPQNPEELRLDGVWFRYPGQDSFALSDINMTLRRGEVVALVGENGSGKTTLGKILTGLYPPNRGSVLWDEVDIATVDTQSVHSQIAVIAQDPAEWPMTAGRNITVGRLDRDDPDSVAWHAALRKSGADEVLAALPAGPDTLLSRKFTGAQDISGGQWQRIGIARGLYRDAPILVADEPTAALDAKAEARVFTALRHASTTTAGDRKTTILVTHRLANIATADRIIVLDGGRIVEHGTHAELMATRGLYSELFTIQASAYTTADRRR